MYQLEQWKLKVRGNSLIERSTTTSNMESTPKHSKKTKNSLFGNNLSVGDEFLLHWRYILCHCWASHWPITSKISEGSATCGNRLVINYDINLRPFLLTRKDDFCNINACDWRPKAAEDNHLSIHDRCHGERVDHYLMVNVPNIKQ